MGTFAFRWSMARLTAARACARCGDETAIMTLASETGTIPSRWTTAIFFTSENVSRIPLAMASICPLAISLYAEYSSRRTFRPLSLSRVVPTNTEIAPQSADVTKLVTCTTLSASVLKSIKFELASSELIQTVAILKVGQNLCIAPQFRVFLVLISSRERVPFFIYLSNFTGFETHGRRHLGSDATALQPVIPRLSWITSFDFFQINCMYARLVGFGCEKKMSNETLVEEDWFGRYRPEVTPAAEGAATAHVEPVRRFTLTNHNKIVVQVLTYGATITSIKVPDKHLHYDDIVLGFDKIQDYYAHVSYFGSTVGRVANRIANGKFILNGRTHQLACNNGPNHLHGGIKGFDKTLWDSHVEGSTVILSYRSKDGEEGYPGEVNTRVSFDLTPENELIIRYHAKATKQTPINLTNHSYFNLSGQASEDIKNHYISINADHYLPKSETSIPTGEIASVDGTVFDLRAPRRLGDVLTAVPGGGYDHNFCIKEDSESDDSGRRMVARVVHPLSGRVMEVLSTLPGVQFYTANFLPSDDSLLGKGSVPYRQYSGLCLETQYFPDSVNKPNFPNCIFGPDDEFEAVTMYRFSTLQ